MMKINPATAIKSTVMMIFSASLVACANPSHVLVYQHSNFGVNAGLNPATQSTHIRVGMRNEFAIITPRLYTEEPILEDGVDTGKKKEGYKAASSYISTRFRVSDPFKAPEVAEIVATGNAATTIGKTVGASAFLGETSSNGTTTKTN